MKLETPFIALFIGALVFTGLYTLFIGMADNYNVPYDLSDYKTAGNNNVSLQEAFGDINKTKGKMDLVTQDFYNTTVLESQGGGLFGFFSATWSIGRLIGNNLLLYTNLTTAIAELIGIPPIVVTTFLSILFVVFAITVLMILMGRIYT